MYCVANSLAHRSYMQITIATSHFNISILQYRKRPHQGNSFGTLLCTYKGYYEIPRLLMAGLFTSNIWLHFTRAFFIHNDIIKSHHADF